MFNETWRMLGKENVLTALEVSILILDIIIKQIRSDALYLPLVAPFLRWHQAHQPQPGTIFRQADGRSQQIGSIPPTNVMMRWLPYWLWRLYHERKILSRTGMIFTRCTVHRSSRNSEKLHQVRHLWRINTKQKKLCADSQQLSSFSLRLTNRRSEKFRGSSLRKSSYCTQHETLVLCFAHRAPRRVVGAADGGSW